MQVEERPLSTTLLHHLHVTGHKNEQIIGEVSSHRGPPNDSGGVGGSVAGAGDAECELLKPGTYQLQQQRKQTVCVSQLYPNLQPSSPVPRSSSLNKQFSASLVGNKYLIEVVEGSTLCRCINVVTQEEYVCKVSLPYLTVDCSMLNTV
jgi:hypothetical protein